MINFTFSALLVPVFGSRLVPAREDNDTSGLAHYHAGVDLLPEGNRTNSAKDLKLMQNPEITAIAPVTKPLARLEGSDEDQKGWTRKEFPNIMASEIFSTDRTIAGLAKDIWDAKNVTCHEANHLPETNL